MITDGNEIIGIITILIMCIPGLFVVLRYIRLHIFPRLRHQREHQYEWLPTHTSTATTDSRNAGPNLLLCSIDAWRDRGMGGRETALIGDNVAMGFIPPSSTAEGVRWMSSLVQTTFLAH